MAEEVVRQTQLVRLAGETDTNVLALGLRHAIGDTEPVVEKHAEYVGALGLAARWGLDVKHSAQSALNGCGRLEPPMSMDGNGYLMFQVRG